MKNLSYSRLCITTWAALFASVSFVSCSDDKKGDPTPPPVELKNQLEYNGGNLVDLKSAIFDIEDTDLYTFYLSPRKDVVDLEAMTSTNDYLRVTVRNPKGTVAPATDEFEIAYKDVSVKKQTLNDVESVQLTADIVAETNVLNLYVEVVLKSGKKLLVRYNAACSETVPVSLSNQIELDKTITAIESATQWIEPETGRSIYVFYDANEVGILHVAVDKDVATEQIDLSTADRDKLAIDAGDFHLTSATTGTLNLAKIEMGVTLTLEARNSNRLRVSYVGACPTSYYSNNELTVTAGETAEKAGVSKVFCFSASALQNHLAFGLAAQPAAAADLMGGKYAVDMVLSELSIGKTIDLSTAASQCALKLFDYTNYVTYDAAKTEGVTGTVTTYGTLERLYVYVKATFPDGPTVEGDWFGDVTKVEEEFDITPVEPFVPHVIITKEDGTELLNWPLSSMEMRKVNNYKLRGGAEYGGATFDAYFFYFRREGYTGSIGANTDVPWLMIPVSFIPSTDLDLAVAQTDLHWTLRFANINLRSGSSGYTETSGSGWSATYGPTVAKTTMVQNADKTWNISFTMKDLVPNSYNPSNLEGTKNTITIEWRGAATKYTGTDPNDLTDADY